MAHSCPQKVSWRSRKGTSGLWGETFEYLKNSESNFHKTFRNHCLWDNRFWILNTYFDVVRKVQNKQTTFLLLFVSIQEFLIFSCISFQQMFERKTRTTQHSSPIIKTKHLPISYKFIIKKMYLLHCACSQIIALVGCDS